MIKTDERISLAPSSTPAILHLVGGNNSQGGVLSYVRTITRQPLRGFEQFIWKYRHYPRENESFVSAGWSKTLDRNFVEDLIGAILDLIPLYLWLRTRNTVILHAHTRAGAILSAIIRVIRPVPVVIHVHGLWRKSSLHRFLWRLTRATVVFNSRQTCLHYDFSPEISHVLPPPIQWPPRPSAGKGRFVASSMIVRLKNVHLIIESFLQMAQPGQSLHVYGVSSDPLEQKYQDEIVRIAKSHSNICLHQWDRTWTESLASNDIFVHASGLESFGIVLLEAYAKGCRMVVPFGTFLDDLPSAGVFRAHLNSPAIAQSMAEAAAAPPLNDLWQERQSVAHLFSLENTRRKLSEIYNAQLQRR